MKKSSYQKQKQRIAELERQLNIVVFSPNSIEALNISSRLAFKRDSTEDKISILEANGLIIRYPL